MSISTAQMAAKSTEALDHMNAELVQANRRLRLLVGLAKSFIIANPSPESVGAALDAAAVEIGARFYFNYEPDDDRAQTLTLKLFGGLEQSVISRFARVEIPRSLCGLVAETRNPVAVGDIRHRDDEMAASLKGLGVTAYLGYPLLAHGELLGTIGFATVEEAGFTDADHEFVQMLAEQISALLDQSRLVERLLQNESRYRTALSVGRVGTWETDYLKGTRLWSQEGMELFGLSLPGGRGRVGGEDDEYARSLHPEDRHLAKHYHTLADRQDAFPAEYRVVRPDGSVLWLSGHGQVVARGLDGRAHRLVSIMVDITERKTSENNIQSLLREMSHRSKNLLSVIQAIAGQTVRTAGTMEEFAKRFILRLHGLANSHDILVDQAWQGAPLAALVRIHLAPFVDGDASRLEMSGPDVVLSARAAQAIGMALHELATNAAKHGALRIPGGKVVVEWDIERDSDETGRLRVTWSEHGGPPVKSPLSKGFGHVVISNIVADSLNGEASIDYAPQGLVWRMSASLENVLSGTQGGSGAVQRGSIEDLASRPPRSHLSE
jgi:PAS domain S-box-containing protein